MTEIRYETKISDLSLSIGLPCGPNLPWQTALSLALTTKACAVRGLSCQIDLVANSSIVTHARSRVVDAFLKGNKKKLFWIDSDITWQPVHFIRLLVLSAKMDIVGASYPFKSEPIKFAVPAGITNEDYSQLRYNEYGCAEVHGYGMGFCVMDRKVVEDVARDKPEVLDQWSQEKLKLVFRTGAGPDGTFEGEDMAFFRDARDLGYKVWLEPTIPLGHIGPKEYRGDLAAALGSREKRDAA